MRIATALVFTALVCATQAQLFPQLSGIGQSIGDRIKELSKNIDEQLQQAEERLQSSYKQAREQVEAAYKRVEEAAEGVRDRAKSAVDNVQENIQKQVDEMAQNAAGEGVDVSTCTSLVQSFRTAGDGIVSDVASCVTKKIQKGKDIATDLFNKGQESIDVVTGIRTQAKECVEKVEGVAQQFSAVTCLMSVGAKATWALTTKVPAVARDYAKAVALVWTLPPSLGFCMTKNSILAFAEQGSTVVADVRKCIADRVEAAKEGNSEKPEEVPATENPSTESEHAATEAEHEATEAEHEATEAEHAVTEAVQEATEAEHEATEAEHAVTEAVQEATEAEQEATEEEKSFTTASSEIDLPGFEEVPQNEA